MALKRTRNSVSVSTYSGHYINTYEMYQLFIYSP